jgi:hypothetical protein
MSIDNNLSEEQLRHSQDSLRHYAENLHVIQQKVPHFHVSTPDIQAITNEIFVNRKRGIEYRDLLKPPYKRCNSKKQAQKVLRNHKDRGTLVPSFHRAKPQQYFLTKEDAEEAALKYNKMRHFGPTGVPTQNNNPLYTPLTEQEIAIEERKVDSITEAIELIAQDHNGNLPVGLHNIRISLQLPPQFAEEVYNERLSLVPPSKTKERSKRIADKIDGFKVDVFFYPNKGAETVIIVSCSDRPFPISLNSPERLTSDFTSFVAQIRGFICSHLSDSRGAIVPPIHNHRSWRLAHGEFNWDVPVTTMQYLGMDGVQINTIDEITKRIYRKRIEGKRFIRCEGTHKFAPEAAAIDECVGDSLVAAARKVQKKLSMRGGGD